MENNLQGGGYQNLDASANDTLNMSSTLVQDSYDARASEQAALKLKEFKKHQNLRRDNFMTESNTLASGSKPRGLLKGAGTKGDVTGLEQHRKSASIAMPQNASDSSFTLERRS